jgi:hypothetical protein
LRRRKREELDPTVRWLWKKKKNSEAARTKGWPLIATASREKGKAEGDAM